MTAQSCLDSSMFRDVCLAARFKCNDNLKTNTRKTKKILYYLNQTLLLVRRLIFFRKQGPRLEEVGVFVFSEVPYIIEIFFQ